MLSPWYLQEYVPQLYGRIQSDVNQYKALNTIQSFDKRDDANLQEVIVANAYGLAKEKKLTNAAASIESIDPSTLQKYTTLTESQLNTNFEI